MRIPSKLAPPRPPIDGPPIVAGGIAREELMTRTKIVGAFLQRIAKLNSPPGGQISSGGSPADVRVGTLHEPEAIQADEAVRTVESGLIRRKF
jgi:hypothetical protein